MIDKLFVYGTLRRDAPNGRSSLLGDAEFAGYARMAGHLLDLGHFPGFVPVEDPGSRNHESGDASWVHGELYTLRNPGKTLPRLDRYEGCGPDDPEPHLFERVMKPAVHAPSGQEDAEPNDEPQENAQVDAWTYVYRGPTVGGLRIPSGDYARYRR